MPSILNKIREDKYFIFLIIAFCCVAGWFLNFRIWHIGWLYFLFSIFYFLFNSVWLGKILGRWGFEVELQFFFGLFLLLYLIGFGMAIPIVFYKITPIWLFGLLLVLTAVIFMWARRQSAEPPAKINFDEDKGAADVPRFYYWLFIICYLFGWFLLFRARTGEFIRSPWDKLHPFYLYAWLIISFVLGLMVFSKCKLKVFLLMVILSSFLLHAYVIVPYAAGFGGDKWRHIGAEKWLMDGKIYTPSLFGEKISYKQIGPLRIPEVFLVGNKTSYANLWGLTIALSWLTGINAFWVDLILGIFLYSLFLPFLLLKIGSLFSKQKNFLYLIIFLSFLFFPFQLYGSITVPLSFGFLPFLFAFIFILLYFFHKRAQGSLTGLTSLLGLVFLGLFLYLNYVVYLVLFIEILVLAALIKWLNIQTTNRKKCWLITLLVFWCIVMCLLIPLLDTGNQYSTFKKEISTAEIIKSLKDFSLRLITSQAIFPRIQRFEQDNWLYAQIQEYYSRATLLKVLPWPLILTPIIWLLVFIGFATYRKLSNPKLGLFVSLILIAILVNQMISTYFMEGNHIFSKRLVMITSFLILIPLAWGIYQLIYPAPFGNNASHLIKCIAKRCGVYKIPKIIFARQALIVAVVLFLSLVSATVYASGPKMQTVTKDELTAAEYVWQQANAGGLASDRKYCVLANTWPLLALEAVSGRQITTGGFPFYYEYRQPERVQLFDNMNTYPSIRYLEKSLEITEAKFCYFMTEKRWVLFEQRDKIVEQLDEMLGAHQDVGEVMIWLYQPNYIDTNIRINTNNTNVF